MAKYFQLSHNEISIDNDETALVTFTESHFNQATEAGASAFLVRAYEDAKSAKDDPAPLKLGELEKRSNAKVKHTDLLGDDPAENSKYTFALVYHQASEELFGYAIEQVGKFLSGYGVNVVPRVLSGDESLSGQMTYGSSVYVKEGTKTSKINEGVIDPLEVLKNPAKVGDARKPVGKLALRTEAAKTAINSLADYRKLQRAFGRHSVIETTKNEDRYEPLVLDATKRSSWVAKVADATKAQSSETLDLFVKSGRLIRIVDHTVVEMNNSNELLGYLDSHTDTNEEENLEKYGHRTVPIRLASWVKGADSSEFSIDGYHMQVADVQHKHADIFLCTPKYFEGMNQLKSLSGAPYMKKDGTLAVQPGYDTELEVYVDRKPMSKSWDHSGATQQDAQAALQWLKEEVYVDFPFESSADLANLLGAPLMTMTRYQHGDKVPLVGITAREAGTGKTYLAEILHYIVSDSNHTTMTPMTTGNEEELKKSIGGILQGSDPVIIWDNIENGSVISSPSICTLHTSEVFSTRLLGKSKMLNLVNDRLWIATGNRIRPGEDMVRRWLQIGMDAGHKNPNAAVKKYKHSDIRGWVLKHREEILEKYAIMISAWHNAGRPEAQDAKRVEGGFQNMVNMVSGILEYAGEESFWHNYDEVVENSFSGSGDEELYAFLEWIQGQESIPEEFTASHIYNTLEKLDEELMKKGAAGYNPVLKVAPVPSAVANNWTKGRAAVSRSLGGYLSANNKKRAGGDELVRFVEKTTRRTGNKTHFTLRAETPLMEDNWSSMILKEAHVA